MYKLEVIETVTYSNFDNIVKIQRKKFDEKGKIFVGDIVIVKTKEEVDYLCGGNPKNIIACKIISNPIIENEEESNIKETYLESTVLERKRREKRKLNSL